MHDIAAAMRDIGFCTLATHTIDGSIAARPIATTATSTLTATLGSSLTRTDK